MNSTFRWYSVKKAGKALDVRSFYKLVIKSSTSETWFSPADVTNAIRFHRRIQIQLPEFNEDGSEASRTVETVSSVEFSIVEVGAKTLLRIVNPGRNMQTLMRSIERAVGSGFSARPLAFEQNQPTSILGKVDVKRIVGMKLVNVAVTNDCIGRMEFASKGGIDVSRLPILRGLNYKIDYVKYEIILDGERGAFSFSTSGLVKVGGALSGLIVRELQRDLAKLA